MLLTAANNKQHEVAIFYPITVLENAELTIAHIKELFLSEGEHIHDRLYYSIERSMMSDVTVH